MNAQFVPRRLPAAAAAALLCLQLAGCWGGGDDAPINSRPAGVADVSRTAYTATVPGDGKTAATQDLLTGGLGKSGLLSTAATPLYDDPLNPSALELRRNALLSNYRGLVDATANGGFGRLYGPNIALDGTDTGTEGLIPGVEYIGVLDNAEGTKRVTMAVQVPTTFDQNNPCIVVGPSSGSRGVYGAISTAGEWGLKRGCAVVLTDAGKGIGLHDLSDDSVNRIDGTRTTRTAAGTLANFAAQLTDAVRTAFVTAFPNRVALKQAHSQLNPEKDWGNDTLAAARYALYVLNQEYAEFVPGSTTDHQIKFTPANTLVIAASVSNGGTAVLRAAEADTEGLIDAVVAGEPGAAPASTSGYGVQQGGTPVAFGKPLYDYFSYANLYQPCAALAPEAAIKDAGGAYETSTFNTFNPTSIVGAVLVARATSRCTALAAAGLVSGSDIATQATVALNKLRNYGWGTYNDTMHNAHYGLGNAWIVTSMYANAYGRFSVADNVCGISFGGVDATLSPAPLSPTLKAASFAVANGTANNTPASVIVNDSVGGAKRWDAAVSPSTNQADFGFDNALCLRSLYTGTDLRTNTPLTASTTPTLEQSQRVRAGVAETLANANVRGKPALIVAGRSDALLPVNNGARAYVAANHVAEGAGSQVRYIEVTNGQHFDGFLGFPGFDTRFVPLHVYFVDALNAMYANLKSGTALPASQVVRTAPRGGTPGAAPAVTRALNLPAIAATPAPADAISFTGTALNVPN